MTTQRNQTNPECGPWSATRLAYHNIDICLLVFIPLHPLPHCISAGPNDQENLAEVTICYFEDEVIKNTLAFLVSPCVCVCVLVCVFLLDCLMW